MLFFLLPVYAEEIAAAQAAGQPAKYSGQQPGYLESLQNNIAARGGALSGLGDAMENLSNEAAQFATSVNKAVEKQKRNAVLGSKSFLSLYLHFFSPFDIFETISGCGCVLECRFLGMALTRCSFFISSVWIVRFWTIDCGYATLSCSSFAG